MDTNDKYNLNRFITQQEFHYSVALKEIQAGRKQSHWMWYIFPQLKALGFSQTAKYFGIENLEEAKAYFENPILGPRLVEISQALLSLEENNPDIIFGFPDNLKLRSSMTLFQLATPNCEVFSKVLDKFFNGQRDEKTLELVK